MDDERLWAALVGAPLWLTFLTYFVKTIGLGPNFMARWNERRRDVAEIESDQVARMDARMERLEERCKGLENAHEECLAHLQDERDGRAAERAGRLEAEALLMARQRTDQGVQLRLSAERQIDADARNTEDNGETSPC